MNLPKFYTHKLKNQLEVVAIPSNRGSNVISVNIIYKVGSRNEIMGKSGIAHMLEHMNFKSTKNLKEGEFDKIVKSLGGVDNAFTSFDYTQYYIKTAKEHLETDLYLFAEVMQNLNLTDEEFQRERQVVYEERLWRTDNSPLGYLYFRLFNNAFLYHPYHWTPIGFKEDILNWDIRDIRHFHKTFYQPKNAAILVVGDIDAQEVFTLANKYFAHIKNKAAIPKVHQKEPLLDGDKYIHLQKESEVEMVAIAYQIPNFAHPHSTALSALGELLTSGKDAILNKKLIYQKQLASQIYAYPTDTKDDGLFVIIAIANPGIKAQILEKEIKHILKNYKVTQKNLTKLKLNTKMDFITSLQSSDTLSYLFGSYLAKGDLTPLIEYENRINQLTTQNILEMKQYFTNSITLYLKSPS
ncbi:MAG: insulinase family protein [Epsilonproteobacteria bacterium]|nr:insulinase family protein [Campylobacterota bacterium]